jgi:branched-chain amino acid transport system permease protein
MVDIISLLNAIVSGILIGSVYSLVAMGLSLIWGIMDIINFAQGDYMMLGAFVTYWMLVIFGIDPMVSVIISFAVVFALGVLTQIAVIDHIIEAPFVSQVVSTFALLMIIRYGSETIFGPYTRRVETWYTGITYNYLGIILPLPEIIAFIVTILVTLTLYIFLNKTYVGVAMQAVSQNRDAAALLGINIRRMYWFAFGIGVGITAIAGTLLSTFCPIYPEMGAFFAFLAFIIVVFGGFGSIFGSYVAGLIIGVTETVSALFIIPTWKDVIAFLIFVIIILFRPTGLFGVKTTS